MYVQTTPPRSTAGYAAKAWIFSLNTPPSGAFGRWTQSPSTLYFQPWYAQRSPPSSLRPQKRLAWRCGHR